MVDVRDIRVLRPWHGLINIDNCFIADGIPFDIGTRVIKWWEPQGYNGYSRTKTVSYYEDRKTGKPKIIRGKRYGRRLKGMQDITQFMIHHTGGDGFTARNVYNTLHNHRGLSVHYIIDDDGTIWQTLDVKERAWHAGKNNRCSIGVEAMLYPLASVNPNYYSPERNRRNRNLPHEIVQDTIHGRTNSYFQFTAGQLDSMAKLVAGNWVALASLDPSRDLEPPKFAKVNGKIPRTVIPDPLGHHGLIGHLQATRRKIDPAGFKWEAFEEFVGAYYRQMIRGGQ